MDPIPTDTAPTNIARFLLSGHFRFKELKDAYALAEFLGKICPNPRLHIMAISEILVNAIEHGNLGISAEEKHLLQKENRWLSEIERRLQLPQHVNQYVNLDVTHSESELRLHIKDDGQGFNWEDYKNKNRDNQSTQGRGILMAQNLAFKSIDYSEKGNEVVCVIALL